MTINILDQAGVAREDIAKAQDYLKKNWKGVLCKKILVNKTKFVYKCTQHSVSKCIYTIKA